MNLENEINAHPTVQTCREVTTSQGCKVTLVFRHELNPTIRPDVAKMLLSALQRKAAKERKS